MPSSFFRRTAILASMIVTFAGSGSHAIPPIKPNVDLREMLVPSPLREVATGSVLLSGKAAVADGQSVRVRVTTSLGYCFEAETKASGKRFACRYPQDVAGAPPLSPLLLYVDATDAAEFGGSDMLEYQAEALLALRDGDRVVEAPVDQSLLTQKYTQRALDFFPTFARLAGAAVPTGLALDGEDISLLLKGKPSAHAATVDALFQRAADGAGTVFIDDINLTDELSAPTP